MSIKVAIFEDDKDVAELLAEMMESRDFKVTSFYTLLDVGWQNADIILGDFRNKIVSFKTLQSECGKRKIPLIAISGADTDYSPQLIKPFSIEDLQAMVLHTLVTNKKLAEKTSDQNPIELVSNLFRKSS